MYLHNLYLPGIRPPVSYLQFLICRLLGLSVSLVTLPDGGGVGGNNESAANKSSSAAVNATTTNPHGDLGTASCRGQVSSQLSRVGEYVRYSI